jgi:hypothetical protein
MSFYSQALSKSQKKRLAKKKKDAREKAEAAAAADGEAAAAMAPMAATVVAEDAGDEAAGVENAGAAEQGGDGGEGGAAKTKKKEKKGKGDAPTEQTEPPSIPVSTLYPDGNYPEGEWQDYISECAPRPPRCSYNQHRTQGLCIARHAPDAMSTTIERSQSTLQSSALCRAY